MFLIDCWKRLVASRWLDIIIFFLFVLICFISFLQNDIPHTTVSSFAYLNGHFDDLYDFLKSDNVPCINGNNYMPTTYIIYAIFMLPLMLLGYQFKMCDWDMTLFLIVKGIPYIFYFASAYLLYQIGKGIGFSPAKSKILALLFITNPLAFHSQFIFGQYDIFTVFFMLIGILGYVRKNVAVFLLSFMVAITCKYFALLVFVPLLLLRYKKLWQIILGLAVVFALFGTEYYYYKDSPAFMSGVFNFGAFQRAFVGQLKVSNPYGLDLAINFFIVLFGVVCALAYFIKPKDQKNEYEWMAFLALAGLVSILSNIYWHPQWLLILAPFMSLVVMMHNNQKRFLIIDVAIFVVFILYSNSAFAPGFIGLRLLTKGFWALENVPYLKVITSQISIMYSLMIVALMTYTIYHCPLLNNHRENFINDTSQITFSDVRTRFWTAMLFWGVICMIVPFFM